MPVLVLNSSLQPLSVIPERRLIVLLSKQKVSFVDENVRTLIEESIAARRLELERPVIVQLLANVRVPRVALQPTRSNILLRDEETCQYCGKRGRDLTLDHIIPRSRGGQSTWENLVASCKFCNGKKRQSPSKRCWDAPVETTPCPVSGICRVLSLALS
jgi:5-methylcytosine-specific restriction endonuclease McrA